MATITMIVCVCGVQTLQCNTLQGRLVRGLLTSLCWGEPPEDAMPLANRRDEPDPAPQEALVE